MRARCALVLALALTLAAGCGPRLSFGPLPTPTPDPVFAGLRLFEKAGVDWFGAPRKVLAEEMTYGEASQRLGWEIAEGDRTPGESRVWLVVMQGRYRINPVDPAVRVVGPHAGCVYAIFTTSDASQVGMGDAPCFLPTPVPTATPTPAPTATLAYWAAQAADFGFRYDSGACYNDVLDTFTGTVRTDIDYDPIQTLTFHVALSEAQLRAVYLKMVQIDFWDYPDVFTVPTPWRGFVTPAPHPHILVRNAGVEKSIDWLDEIFEPTDPRADQLRELFHMLNDIILAVPGYPLPMQRGYGCL